MNLLKIIARHSICLLALLLLCAVPRAAAADFAGGKGTAADPYQIATAAQLNKVRSNLSAHYKLTADIVFTEADFALGGTYYNSGKGWTPIGSASSPFKGTFDGNGHTIDSLYQNISSTSDLYGGLFGYISGATVKNLRMENSEILAYSNVSSYYTTRRIYVGSIVGYMDGASTVENCSNTGTVQTTPKKDNNSVFYGYTGGIVGYANSNDGLITGCRNEGSVSTVLSKITGRDTDYVGGIAAVSDAPIKESCNLSAVTGPDIVGGIVGKAYANIERCYNTGNISGQDYRGGIVGSLNSSGVTIQDCYNTGTINSSFMSTGGIVGYVYYSATGCTIRSCYNIGSHTILGSSGTTQITVASCYFVKVSGVSYDSTDGTPRTLAQMRQQSTFTGFDFDNVWTMEGNKDYLYPELRAQEMIFEKSLLRIELTAQPDKTDYLEGEPFDPTGMIVTAYYDNGTSAVIEPNISCDTSTVGTQTVTLTYGGKTLTFEITVQEDPLPGLAAQIVFTYDEATRTAALTNVPDSVRTVLAGYAEDKMIFAELWDTAGTLAYTLPEGCTPDSLLAYILTMDWRPICEPLLPTRKPAADDTLIDVSGETARTAVLAEGTLELAAQLPDAAWNSLPDWNGVTVPNLQEYGFEYVGQPQVFSKEDMKNISDLGFNFVRVPLDTRIFLDWDDPGKVHSEKLENLDELISWGAEFGTHVCVDVHSSFGFTTDGDNTNDTIWEEPEEQEIFLSFWDLLAERYQEVPSNLLSFNLMNEPNWGLDEEVYADLMRRAMERIRTHTPDRLIFVDMLNTAREPVYSLVEDEVAQSFHFYDPNTLTHAQDYFDLGGAYPVIRGKGFISHHVEPAEFVMEGDFPAGTKLVFLINEVHKGGTISLTADGTEIFSNEYDYDAVGEDGCIYLREEGTDGEFRGYDNVFEVVLPEDASVLRLYPSGDIYWFNLERMYILTDENRYVFEQNTDSVPEDIVYENIPNPHIIIHTDGTITDEGNILHKIVDGAYIHDRLAAYKAFSEETGVAVMMQEFGVTTVADYGLTLEYLDDLLDAANANGLNWCGWDYFGPFNFYSVDEYDLREGATYEEFSNGWIATEMLEVYQNHLTQ